MRKGRREEEGGEEEDFERGKRLASMKKDPYVVLLTKHYIPCALAVIVVSFIINQTFLTS